MASASPLLALPSMAVDLQRIEVALRDAVQTPNPYLTEIASHLILAGGKRLRPVLAVAGACTSGADAGDDVVLGGVSVELVHIGSLYHDDVMDEAEMRRGQVSVNVRWGNLKAILAGDFLLARASEIAASLGTEVAGLLARTIGRLCEGQIGELRHTFDAGRTQDSYIESINGKTASLFASACRIGGIVGGLPRPQIDALTKAGEAYGMAFQIADDVLDLTATEEQLGKPSGHDLVEGVYTLPVILTLAKGGAPAEELRDLLGSPIDGAELDKALSLVRSNGGVPEAITVARGYANQAAQAAAALDDTPATRALAVAGHALLDSLLA
ncbi:MAG TPA: polyprenyl synthetase family protein [Acidimicrobiales bacterium]